MSIFNLLLSLSPFFYLSYFYFFVKKKYNKSISWDISQGLKCYSCKSHLNSFEDLVMEAMLKNKSLDELKGEKLCTPCIRDEKINLVSNNLFSILESRYKRFIILNYKKFMLISISLIILFLVLDIFVRINGFRIFFYTGQTLQLIYWYSFIYRWKITSIKKPNQD